MNLYIQELLTENPVQPASRWQACKSSSISGTSKSSTSSSVARTATCRAHRCGATTADHACLRILPIKALGSRTSKRTNHHIWVMRSSSSTAHHCRCSADERHLQQGCCHLTALIVELRDGIALHTCAIPAVPFAPQEWNVSTDTLQTRRRTTSNGCPDQQHANGPDVSTIGILLDVQLTHWQVHDPQPARWLLDGSTLRVIK